MRLEQLENVVEIAKYESINRAAIELHLAQQSLMSSLNSLENELGFKIFERSRKGVTPSEAGATFLEEARTVLQICHGWSRFRQEAEQLKTVQVAMVSAFRQDISELCMEVFARYGDQLSIQSEPCYLNSGLDDLRKRVQPDFLFYLDADFCSLALPESIRKLLSSDAMWCSETLYDRPCEVFVPASHQWLQEGKKAVTYQDLERETLIINSKNVVSVFPNCQKIYLPNKEGLLQAILTGKGVGISLSTTITDQFYLDSKQIVGLPLLHDGRETPIYFKLLHRREELLNAAEKKLLPIILQYYKEKVIHKSLS